MRLAACVSNDFRLQFRHGFHLAYAFVTVFYALFLRALPQDIRQLLLPIFIFNDPALAGLFFVGGVVLLERGDGVFDALSVTPVSTRDYMLSKVLSLTALSVASSLAVAAAAGGLALNWPLLALGAALSAVPFILIGILIVSRFRGLATNMVVAGLVIAPLLAPFLEYFGVLSSRVFWLSPVKPAIILITAGLRSAEISAWEVLASIIVLVGWSAGLGIWAWKWFSRYVVGRISAREKGGAR